MSAITSLSDPKAAIWKRVLQLEDGISPAAARALLKIQFSSSDAQRMAILAAKARTGKLTADEHEESDAFERLGCMLDILHSQARRVLKRHRKAS